MRFEDSPDLFGCGMGIGTYGNILCEWCGKVYDGREDESGDPNSSENKSISVTHFAGKQICDCCYEKIENEIISRMDDIIPWFIRILEEKHKNIHRFEAIIERLKEELNKEKKP